MRVGIVGLGRMGGNMAERLQRGGHEVVGFATRAESREAAAARGTEVAESLDGLVAALEPPRVVWLMVPAGEATASTVSRLGELLEAGDLVVDGGNSHHRDSRQRARELGDGGIDFIDSGVSGGIWGLDEGYCLMVGGTEEAVERLRRPWRPWLLRRDGPTWGRTAPGTS